MYSYKGYGYFNGCQLDNNGNYFPSNVIEMVFRMISKLWYRISNWKHRDYVFGFQDPLPSEIQSDVFEYRFRVYYFCHIYSITGAYHLIKWNCSQLLTGLKLGCCNCVVCHLPLDWNHTVARSWLGSDKHMQVVPWGCNSHRLGYAAPTGMVKYHHLLVELHLLVYSMLAAVAAT